MCSDLRRITVYRALKGNVSLTQCTAIDNNTRIVARWGINITKKKRTSKKFYEFRGRKDSSGPVYIPKT